MVIFLLCSQGLDWACSLKPQLCCILSENLVLGRAEEDRKWLWPISHSGVRGPAIAASWRGVGEMLMGDILSSCPFSPGRC